MKNSEIEFSQEQYDMLKSCSDKEDMKEWNEWRKSNPDVKILLRHADLMHANLCEANLSEANLIAADLVRAKLIGANLSEANLIAANLSYAFLWEIELKGACLRSCDLTQAQLDKSNLTGALTYAWNTTDWSIKGVKCDYIYTDKERLPKDRDFEDGEFEKLFTYLPTIEYEFKNGVNVVDVVLMGQILIEIEVENPEFKIKMISVENTGTIPYIKLNVQSKEMVEKAKGILREKFEDRLATIEQEMRLLKENNDLRLEDMKYSSQMIYSLFSQFMEKVNLEPKFGDIKINGSLIYQPNSNIQDQTISITEVPKKELNDLIQKLKEKIPEPELKLADSKKEEIITLGKKIENELTCKKPKRALIIEYLSSIREILTGATGSMIATGLLNLIKSISI